GSSGAPATFDALEPEATPDRAAWALFNGHLIRDRFTLADLAWFAGAWSEQAAREAIEEAARLATSAAAPEAV
ncbi:MAG TPA: hypothetical protein VGK63_03085, partial [Candidatus Limnocylindrales bacterium]